IAGLIKAALSIRNRELPPSLNYAEPNPLIPFDSSNLQVHIELGQWPRPGQRLVAGVSSFGMGGTNCHVVLAEGPARRALALAGDRPAVLTWTVSAKTRPAVHA